MRLLSYSELTKAMTCEAAWDFSYGGHLTGGDTLKKRVLATRLSNGRAWGAAVATWHANAGEKFPGLPANHALVSSIFSDVADMQSRGVFVSPDQIVDQQEWLFGILDHHMVTAEQLPNLTRLEGEINVPIPSDLGYRFQCFIDGWTVDYKDKRWIVEFKSFVTAFKVKS